MASAGKVMLVAGGSGSIGSAIAREAHRQGWTIAVHGRSAEKVDAVCAALGCGRTAEGFLVDICQPSAAETLVAEVVEQFGRIDSVIDCTATGPGGITGFFAQTDMQAFGSFLDVSLCWLERLAHAAYPHLASEGGTLISFVSDAGVFAAPRQTLIGAARAGAIGFIRNFALEAARDNIRAHCISPSFVEGSESARKMGSDRMAKAASRAGLGLPTAEDIAPLAVFLCGEGARKMTGQVISINGGLNA
ncbi:SDR family NAD(P)-dependent oxidoreductase [Novosphingobium sp. M1R2S20]|uniref:SDR family NAD(P)-dependent oxidoreductase n=1 Tax=Novosphingobium rhizovicinum TaxID=3228928 RepID=A0ABV3R6P9_9SPHN